MLAHDTEKGRNSIISGVYALAKHSEKDLFWDQLIELHRAIDLPWRIIGDLNELANAGEKKGGQVYPI